MKILIYVLYCIFLYYKLYILLKQYMAPNKNMEFPLCEEKCQLFILSWNKNKFQHVRDEEMKKEMKRIAETHLSYLLQMTDISNLEILFTNPESWLYHYARWYDVLIQNIQNNERHKNIKTYLYIYFCLFKIF